MVTGRMVIKATQNSAEIVTLDDGEARSALPETGRLAVMINNLGGRIGCR